jgi:hypothetical protein
VLVTSPGRKAYIAAQGGILNANTAGDAAVIAGAAIFRSEEGVGENGNTLVTRVQSMEGEVLGGMWVHNMGALSVGNAGDGTGGTTTAGGGIEITASSPVTVVADVVAAADMVIISAENTADDDITVRSAVTVRSTGGSVSLYSGDGVSLESGSVVEAAGTVHIRGDYGNTDPGVGSLIDLQGDITASSVLVEGGADDDTVVIPALTSQTEVRTGDGDDVIRVGRNASATGNTGGALSGVQAALSVYGGPHPSGDSLILDDSANTGSGEWTVDGATVTGSGMTGSIHYEEIENLGIAFGHGDNTINILSTSAGTAMVLTCGAGDDTFNISSDAPANLGDLDGIRGNLVLAGGEGVNSLNLSDLGNVTGRSGAVIADTYIGGMTGDAGGSGLISFDGSFESIHVQAGGGADSIDVLAVLPDTALTLRAGDGDDTVTAVGSLDDGLLLVFGEGGADVLDASAWNVSLVLVGDEGSVTVQDGGVTEAQTQPGLADGNDILISGAGDDILLGGGGSDTLDAGDGVNALVGDEGTVTLQDGVATEVKPRRETMMATTP